MSAFISCKCTKCGRWGAHSTKKRISEARSKCLYCWKSFKTVDARFKLLGNAYDATLHCAEMNKKDFEYA